MAKYKVILEIEDTTDSYSESQIDEAIRNGLEDLEIEVLDSKPFELLQG